MTPGEVYWIEFPAGAGRAQAGRRPAVLLQASEACNQLPTALVVPLTTQLDALRFPGTVLIEPDSENRLAQPSIALVLQTTAVDKRLFGKLQGEIATDKHLELLLAPDGLVGRDLQ